MRHTAWPADKLHKRPNRNLTTWREIRARAEKRL